MKYLSTAIVVLAALGAARYTTAPVRSADLPVVHPQHPRLLFTASELPELRDRIAKYYRSEFQDFVNLLNDTRQLSKRQVEIEANWGGLNYAFVAALDPQEMSRRGIRFDARLSTASAYCERAMSYARKLLPGVSTAAGQRGGALSTGYPEPRYLSVITTYDWCHPHLSDQDRRAIVDAYLSAYQEKYEGRNLLKAEVEGMDMLANARASNDLEDVLGILAFYGDRYPDAAVQEDLLQAFTSIWLDRFLVELNYFYREATGWHEGPGGYLGTAMTSISVPVAMFSSALGVDYVSTTPFFSEYPVFVEANVRPHGLHRRAYYDRWGTISGGIAGPNCKSLMLNAGLLRRAGHPNAALAKWAYEETAGDCGDTVTRYGGTWSNAVLFWFLFGDRGIERQSPIEMKLAHSLRLGLGQYVLRSGYEPSASQVIFYAQEHRMYGHESQEYGTFSLHKFGNLILQAANTKSGEGDLDRGPDKGALFENVVSLHKGASDPGLGFTPGRDVDPFFGARGINRVQKAGTIVADAIGRGGFDYVGYDNSPMWAASAGTVSQREFVYLRGPADKEFLVILDRFDVENPSVGEKIWKSWVPTQPAFVDGDGSMPRPGKWTSSSSTTIELTNEFDGLDGEDFRSAATHGRFFMKTLSPERPVINFIGGPDMEFQSGDDDGTMPWGTPEMTQAEHEYLGWGRVEVRPSVPQASDLFLNVIQFGDADTLEAMAPTSRVDSIDGKMTGAHIGDATNQWVVLMTRRPADQFQIGGATYSFQAAAPESRHLLVNMTRSTTFHVAASTTGTQTTIAISTESVGGTSVTSDDQGVVSFRVNGTQVAGADAGL